MNVLRFSVKRPIFITMATLLAVLLGFVALTRLPIDLMPELTYPTLTVATTYDNAGPEEVEQLITRRIEEAVAAVPGVEDITSVSQEGSSSVRVSFTWGTDLDVASQDVRDRLERILDNLPVDADRPEVRKFDAAATPVLIVGVSGQIDQRELRHLADEQLSDRLARLPGVAAVDVWGGREREIHVNMYPDRLQALGLSLDEVRTALQNANLTLPAGQITNGRYEVNLRVPGEYTTLDDIRQTPIAVRNGNPIYLHQVAEVDDSFVKLTRLVRINGAEGVRMAVRKQSGANTVAVAKRVKAELEAMRPLYPQLTIVPVVDASVYIQRAIANVGQSVISGGLLAVAVLLFFLRSIPATIVTATAIPVSVITTFALLYFNGFTLNLMTLGGLALGVGMMVDSAIVVLENITRRRQEEKEDAETAAIHGGQEVAAAVVAGTLTTLVVFLPMLFAEEVAGVLFRQLTYVVSFSLAASTVVALTLVPTMAARLLARSEKKQRKPSPRVQRVMDTTGQWLEVMQSGYHNLLQWAFRHQRLVIVGALVSWLVAAALVPLLGAEFMPKTDEGEVRVTAEMEPGTRLELLDARMKHLEEMVIKAVPEAVSWVSQLGASQYRSSSPASGEVRITLAPQSQRHRSSEEIAVALRKLLKDQAGAVIRTREGQGLMVLRMGTGDGESLTAEVRGYDLGALNQVADTLLKKVRTIPGVTDARLSREVGVPEERLNISRARAADLDLPVASIARALEVAIAGGVAGVFREGGEEYDIRLQLKNAEKLPLARVMDLRVLNGDGQPVALRNVLTSTSDRGPSQIERRNQQRILNVLINISERDLGSVAADVQAAVNDMALPRGVEVLLSGDYEDQQKTFNEMMLGLLLAIALVYMVLACQYESLKDPLLVMVAVPLAGVGVVLALLLTGSTLNAQSFIGMIMLVGIAVNNAILLVDQASQLRQGGMAPKAAAMEAGRRRLRPVLMTSATTILAMLPLALGIGEGADAQAPLARAVMGGLLSSTLTVLLVVPVLYSWMYRK